MKSFKEYQLQRILNEQNIFNEQWMIIDSHKFLKNPTAHNLEQVILKINQKPNDYSLRGISDGVDIYWADASNLTHFDMARILNLNYQKCERLYAYKDSYGDIVIDFSQGMSNNPRILRLGLDDDGFLPKSVIAF